MAPDTTETPDAPAADTAGGETTAPDAIVWTCQHSGAERPDFLTAIGCRADFDAVAAAPLDASIPGAISLKTVIDRIDDDALFFQNSDKYAIHYEFAAAHRSGNGLPPVASPGIFSDKEYTAPQRRFILGAVSYYEEPGLWVYEIAPYDTADATLIATAFRAIRDATYFGAELRFHPTSDTVEQVVDTLPDDIPVISTDDLFGDITFQPLNLGTSFGRLRFRTAATLDTAALDFRDIVVLDSVPNDIAVVSGIITAALQTPLSHINVLSQNRGTPNMALIGALENADLRALEDQWVALEVTAFDWSVRAATQAEADTWWQGHRPEPLDISTPDASVTDLRDIEGVLDLGDPEVTDDPAVLGAALAEAIPAFGGKASHYSALTRIPGLPVPKAFGIPVSYYLAHLEDNGLDTVIAEMLADTEFQGDVTVRATRLDALRDQIRAAPIDPALLMAVEAKIRSDLPVTRVRFRSSTNAEDLDGFTGAGLYTSRTGDPDDPDRPVADAIRRVWASIWNLRAFQERDYRGIDHTKTAMALLVHRSFPDEEINGVALTGNLFDRTFLEPAFIINAQWGEASVVKPDPGITTDYFIYYYDRTGQPSAYLSRSNLIPPGRHTVMDRDQTQALSLALQDIHQFFLRLYGATPGRFYGMDVEFKFDGEPGEEPALVVKQARPHPGWGL